MFDSKAVGGHLPLSKRNSTPVTTLGPLHQKLGLQVQSQIQQSQIQSQVQSHLDNPHRRLDRSQSEPVRTQQQQPQVQPDRAANSSRYKTELCRPFEENGFCKYGDKCQFAHGSGELRSLSRHPKYKTELCRTFHTIGFCPYGPRCHFIHAEERRTSRSGAHYSAHSNESSSPPNSLHGSPTSPSSFFDDFTLFSGHGGLTAPHGLLEGLTIGLGINEGGNFGLDTPPVSPVESLAGDLDSLSLSSSSPTPNMTPNMTQNMTPVTSGTPMTVTPTLTPLTSPLDASRFRLPIFEQLCENE